MKGIRSERFRPGLDDTGLLLASDGFQPGSPGEVLIYFSVRGRAAEQGIIFRIQTPGQVPGGGGTPIVA